MALNIYYSNKIEALLQTYLKHFDVKRIGRETPVGRGTLLDDAGEGGLRRRPVRRARVPDAVAAGAGIVNDVSASLHEVAAATGAGSTRRARGSTPRCAKWARI